VKKTPNQGVINGRCASADGAETRFMGHFGPVTPPFIRKCCLTPARKPASMTAFCRIVSGVG